MSIADKITRLQTAKSNIATAITNKGGSVSAGDGFESFSADIATIPQGGGGAVVEKDVNFYDYDGTLLHSYTLAQAQSLSALPDLPTAPTDYTAVSWGTTLQEVQALTLPHNYGVNYSANKVETEFDITVESDCLTWYVYNSSSLKVDWGDGTVDSTTENLKSHSYSAVGNYTVKICDRSNPSSTYNLYGNSNFNLSDIGLSGYGTTQVPCLFSNRAGTFKGNYYREDAVKSIRIGSGVGHYIRNYAFTEYSSLKSIVIPNSVTSIGSICFENCYSLKSIVIPDSVTSIGDYCFENCYSLQSIVIPDSVTSIRNSCFENCSSLQSIVIPDSITSIGNQCFNNCYSLKSIVIPDSVTSIGNQCFYNCSSLQSIVIPDSVTSIGDYCFYECRSIKSIVIPNSVTSIGSICFQNCSSLKSIVIPDSVTSIGNQYFYNCSSLQSIVIPDSVTSIGNSCFRTCSSLKSIVIPDSVTSIGDSCFHTCYSLQSIVIPDSVTSIGNHCFYNCSSLQSIVIPDSVTSIGQYAIANCSSLKSIVIPDSVTSIGDSCFQYSSWLTSVFVKSLTPPSLGSSAFNGNFSTRKIYVIGTLDHSILNAYKAATNWSTYASYIEEEFSFSSIKSIDIEAEDITNGYFTKSNATITYTADVTMYDGTLVNDYEWTIKHEFEVPQNLTDTAVTRTLTYTEGGITATTTITQAAARQVVELIDFVRDTTEYQVAGFDAYRTNVSNVYKKGQIKLIGYSSYELNWKNPGNPSGGYVRVDNPDVSNSSGKYDYRTSSSSTTNPTTITFSDEGEHNLYFYNNNNYSSSASYQLYVYLPSEV